MIPRFLAAAAIVALAGCKEPARQSLVGNFAAPGDYALAGDTITVWKRVRQPNGLSRFHSYSITPGGTVEYLEEPENGDTPTDSEERDNLGEQRRGFKLPADVFEAVRTEAAQLRPASLGPVDPVGGYGGEVYPAGCTAGKTQPRLAGINFLNEVNWGTFILPDGCRSDSAVAAAAAMTRLFDRLDQAARPSTSQTP